MHVLVVDDELPLRESLSRSLRFEGYDVTTAGDGAEALAIVAEQRPDAIVLDVMMPRSDGIDTCRSLRRDGYRMPILVLTARDAVDDRVRGLDAGADDYLVKPFAPEELLARLRSLLRRRRPSPDDDVLTVGDLVLDPGTWTVSHRGIELTLARTEFVLLERLMRAPGQVLSRTRLYEDVWGQDLDGSSNALDIYIGYLRKKLEANGETRILHTVRAVGFVLRAHERADGMP